MKSFNEEKQWHQNTTETSFKAKFQSRVQNMAEGMDASSEMEIESAGLQIRNVSLHSMRATSL